MGKTNDEMLPTPKAAQVLGVKPGTLHSWRQKGEGPDYVQCGRLVRYPKQSLDRFVEANTVRCSRESVKK